MNILLVSQCDKRALAETRRILDQFAERRGDRTWQTPITQDGLTTLHKLLRQTARKNTAVSCHWIRGLDHSELLWIVGDRRRFNSEGAVPTNTTTRNILRRSDENPWHGGELIRLLADLSGLMHDLGKACQAFQDRLAGRVEGKNLIRHEWVSLRLLQSFVGAQSDQEWLERLATQTPGQADQWLAALQMDAPGRPLHKPFVLMQQAPLAQALGWLVVSHHRLPQLPYERRSEGRAFLTHALSFVEASWNEDSIESEGAKPADAAPYWQFKNGLPCQTADWQARAARLARKLLRWADHPRAVQVLNQPLVMHLSRLSLMLADHHYSSLGEAKPGVPVAGRIEVKKQLPTVYANILARAEGSRAAVRYNQTLEEHLLGVAQGAAEVARYLPSVRKTLPHLGPVKALKKRSADAKFQWQNDAADRAETLRQASASSGGFIVNMASTGCGKTLANARIMQALSDPSTGMRCAFAMGLRTLTLQTGQAFRDKLHLKDHDLAIRVGGSASRALFEHFEQKAEATGSASAQELMDEDGHVIFDGSHDDHPLLRRLGNDPQAAKLLMAPILVCTIDHLTPATEAQRGGRQIAPMLRLMSGDLVLDEPDDFDLADLPALTRLVNWAGLLGARVLLSSATLPPALIAGLFEAYRTGRQHWNAQTLPDAANAPAVQCLWVDEFHQHAQACTSGEFAAAHASFVEQRAAQLAQAAAQPRQRLSLMPLEAPSGGKPSAITEAFAAQALQSALTLHREHAQADPASGKRVSFGLIRMANIERLFDVALAIYAQGAPQGVHIHLCVYHSRFPLLMRSATERMLDTCLKRHQPAAVFEQPGIRAALNANAAPDQLFIVLGSPVTEVGRDHDYDWAVVEPSSLRSLIQLLGRVRRHREGRVLTPNVHVFRYPLRHFTQPSKPAYRWPGFETEASPLRDHDLATLLPMNDEGLLDARPRIQANSTLTPTERWADLEHQCLQDQMLPKTAPPATGRRQATPPRPNAANWWHRPPSDSQLTYLLQQQQPFRDSANQREVTLALLPDDDGEQALLHRVMKPLGRHERRDDFVKVEPKLHHPLAAPWANSGGTKGISPWGVSDYMSELKALATELDIDLQACAKRFGQVTVLESDLTGWRSHDSLGFAKKS